MITLRKALVLDANILVRAVLSPKVRSLLESQSSQIQFFAPDVCFDDAKKYLPLIFEKRGLPANPALEVLAGLSGIVQTVEADIYGDYREEAIQRIAIRDPDDWPIVATALALNCPIWTEDADFFGAGIATWTTDRIHLFVRPTPDE